MVRRLDIVLGLTDIFDYAEFKNACVTAGVLPLNIGEYAQKIGMLKVAMNMFPEDTPQDAYMKLVEYMNNEWQQRTVSPEVPINSQSHKDCNGCGGGQVR